MRIPAIISALVLVSLAIAGCTATAPPANPDAAPTVTVEDSPSSTFEPEPSVPAGVELPAGVDVMSDTALAWEALMSPDGEYAAAASYLAVLDRFGTVEPYASILEAELRHIQALTRQLERDGVTVPDNPYIGVVEAPDDLQSAAEAWAEGEILNVAMYDALIAQADGERLVRVLENLRRASLESHLPLFEAAAAAGGTLDDVRPYAP